MLPLPAVQSKIIQGYTRISSNLVLMEVHKLLGNLAIVDKTLKILAVYPAMKADYEKAVKLEIELENQLDECYRLYEQVTFD